MKHLTKLAAMAAFALITLVSCDNQDYETVKGDPMQTRIYTLKNGLKVYLSVNRDEPRIQANIAVKTGSRNDPAETTGLAHYLEHLMFKGTKQFGTTDSTAEAPLLDEIEKRFEAYRQLTDPAARKQAYHEIDSVSQLAAQYNIPNEYDKLMALIGSDGTNAFTSFDITCYVENIPSNEVDNWARIQADRFKNMVIRGFHTELEAVYEEYNMYLNEDSENAMMAIDSVLFKNHPYGTQTVIGTSDHLKNPSIKAIKKQKATYYVPNNTAICVSGDFDPDEFVKIVEKYFGDWQPNPELPVFTCRPEDPITSPVEKDVYGTEAEFVMIGWRYPGSSVIESETADIVAAVLSNGMAGIMDIDLIQQQKVLAAEGMAYARTDYSEFLLDGYPKQGQTLEEVRDLLLASVAKLRSGDFDEKLVEASVANFKLSQMRALERNSNRAMAFVNSFVDGHDWKDDVHQLDRLSKLTKKDIVDWANQYLGENSYVVAYKRVGPNPKNEKIDAPEITPIVTNRDKQSAFLQEIANAPVTPIEPVFVDYGRDMVVSTYKGMELLYKHNDKNDIATLTLWFDRGSDADPLLPFSADYVRYLSTPEHSAAEISFDLYSLASKWNMNVSSELTTVTFRGLAENTEKVLILGDDLGRNAVPDAAVLDGLKADILRSRSDAKMRQGRCNAALQRYMMLGPEFIKATTLTNDQVMALTPEELIDAFQSLFKYEHRILYYGPASLEEVKAMLEHHNSDHMIPVQRVNQPKLITREPKVFVAPYNSRQFNYMQYSNRGEKLMVEQTPYIELFNEYYGTGMNSIVFQEMRESRALAYNAGASLVVPSFTNNDYYFRATIASQNDKLRKAVEGFAEIIETLPEAPENLEIAKAAITNKIRTQRVTGISVLYSYIRNRSLGFTVPREQLIYDKVMRLTMFDLLSTHEDWIRGRTYYYAILGDPKDLDMAFLRTLGPVEVLTQEDIFGY